MTCLHVPSQQDDESQMSQVGSRQVTERCRQASATGVDASAPVTRSTGASVRGEPGPQTLGKISSE